jgi:hypothetical protein
MKESFHDNIGGLVPPELASIQRKLEVMKHAVRISAELERVTKHYPDKVSGLMVQIQTVLARLETDPLSDPEGDDPDALDSSSIDFLRKEVNDRDATVAKLVTRYRDLARRYEAMALLSCTRNGCPLRRARETPI